jgi:hypothetical protein
MAHIRTEKEQQDENLGESNNGYIFHFPDSILSGIVTKSALISPPSHHQYQ